MLTIRLIGIGAVIAILLVAVGNSGQVVQAQQETFRTLTVGKLAGVRLDAANPPAGLPSSGLILGLGADLMVLAGNVTIKRPSDNLAQSVTISTESGGKFSAGTYCYWLTAFVDEKEFLQKGPAQVSVNAGQQVVFRWQVDSSLRDVVAFGAKAGYRVYKFGPLPANTQCGAVQLNQYERIGQVEVTGFEPQLSFTDTGLLGVIGGAPQPADLGNLEVEGNATVQSNLSVGQLAQVSMLQVGPQAPAPVQPGQAVIEDSLGIGALPIGVPGRRPRLRIAALGVPVNAATLWLDARPAGGLWELASDGIGSFTIEDLTQAVPAGMPRVPAGTFCGGGNPRLAITSTGTVGLGVAPKAGAPAGALEIAHSLGVGVAAPPGCGDAIIGNNLTIRGNNIDFGQKKIIEFKALKGGESFPAKVPANVAFVEIATDKADVDYDVNGTKGTVKAGQSAEVAVKPGQTVTVTAKGDTNVTLTFLVRPLFKLVIFERDKKDKPGEKEWLLGIVDCKAPSPKECEELAKDFANASLLIQNGQIQLFNFSGPPDASIGNGAIYFDIQANPATGDPPEHSILLG
jgi:plastocyanin